MTTINEMIIQAEQWEANEADHIASTDELEFGDNFSEAPDWVGQLDRPLAQGFAATPLTEHAAVMLSGMLGLPASARMTRAMFNRAPGTLGNLYNELLDERGHGVSKTTATPKSFLFRTIDQCGDEYPLDNQVRAVMGSNWTPHKNSTILRMVEAWADGIRRNGTDVQLADRMWGMRGVTDVTINDPDNPISVARVSTFSPDWLNIILTTNITVDIDGDSINPGMYISSSQIKRLKTRTGPATWRLICTNGLRTLVKGFNNDDVVFEPYIGHVISEPEFEVAFTRAMMNCIPFSMKAIQEQANAQRVALYEENATMNILFEKLLPENQRQKAAMAAGRGDSINGTPNTLGHLTNTLSFVAHQVDGMTPALSEQLEMVAGTTNRTINAWGEAGREYGQQDIVQELFRTAGVKLDEDEGELAAVPVRAGWFGQ